MLTFISLQRSENVIIGYIGISFPINDFKYLTCVLFWTAGNQDPED